MIHSVEGMQLSNKKDGLAGVDPLKFWFNSSGSIFIMPNSEISVAFLENGRIRPKIHTNKAKKKM
jgi:hypothetical protein